MRLIHAILLAFVALTFTNLTNASQLKIGKASWYGGHHHGKKTASGERFNMYANTAAHKSLPFGTLVEVTNKSNGKSVVVVINDRGPYHGNRVLDLSKAAAQQIDMTKSGTAIVEYRILE